MHTFMVRLSHAMRRWRWAVIAVWIVLVGVSLPFSRMNGDNLSAGFSGVQGSESETVQDALDAGDFGTAGQPQIGVVVEPGASATAQQVNNTVSHINASAKNTNDVVLTDDNLQQARQAAQAVQPFIVPIRIDSTLAESAGITENFIDRLQPGTPRENVNTYLSGQSALQAEQVTQADSGADTASDVSLIVILILLLATFGGLVAAFVPLLLGFAAVAVTGMAIYFLSQAVTISIFSTSLAAMIGLAVAVDYTLFILMRYRGSSRAATTAVMRSRRP
jgi:RND superfamily putative drug exporter